MNEPRVLLSLNQGRPSFNFGEEHVNEDSPCDILQLRICQLMLGRILRALISAKKFRLSFDSSLSLDGTRPTTEPLILLASLPCVPKSGKRSSATNFCRGEWSEAYKKLHEHSASKVRLPHQNEKAG